VLLEDTVDSEFYVQVIREFLLDPRETPFVEQRRVLQQDGARPHTAKHSMAFFAEKNVEVLPWAPYSPDWNPIENLWSILKRRMTSTCFDTKDELIDEVFAAWESIEQETLDNLAMSFEKRLLKTIEVGGEDCQL
jgi:transposase